MAESTPIRAVMFFVDSPRNAGQWYADHVGGGAPLHVDGDFAWFEVGTLEVGFHPSDDDLNPRGASQVVYWQTDDVEAARQRLLSAGCAPHRGPLTVSPDRQICQVLDPFGNVLGLDGP